MSENLDDFEAFQSQFRSGNYLWIIGDGGAYVNLPRLACFKRSNHKFIINGIGEVLGDSIIIENQGKLFQYIL